MPIFNADLKDLVAHGAEFIQIEDLGAWMLALDGDNDWVIDVLNAWIDGVDAKIAWHCCLGAGYGNTFRAVEDALPRVLERWMDVNVEQYALDFALRDMVDVKALEVIPPDKEVQVGVIDIRTLYIESDDEIVDRIHKALEHIDPSRSTSRPTAASRRCRGSAPTRSSRRCRAPPRGCARRSARRRPPPRSPDRAVDRCRRAVAVAAPAPRGRDLAALPAGELLLDAVELGRRAVQPPAVAHQRHDREERTQIGQNDPLAPTATQIAVQIANGTTAPPLCWSSRRWSSRRGGATSAALLLGARRRQRRQVGAQRVELAGVRAA